MSSFGPLKGTFSDIDGIIGHIGTSVAFFGGSVMNFSSEIERLIFGDKALTDQSKARHNPVDAVSTATHEFECIPPLGLMESDRVPDVAGFKVLRELGKGSFSRVVLAERRVVPGYEPPEVAGSPTSTLPVVSEDLFALKLFSKRQQRSVYRTKNMWEHPEGTLVFSV